MSSFFSLPSQLKVPFHLYIFISYVKRYFAQKKLLQDFFNFEILLLIRLIRN